MIQEGLRKEMSIALKMLTPREANVISLSFSLNGNDPMSLQEIGDRYGLSSESQTDKRKASRDLNEVSERSL